MKPRISNSIRYASFFAPLLLLLAVLAWPPARTAQAQAPQPLVKAVDSVGFTVRDVGAQMFAAASP